jgi:hypothetical protein
MTKLQSSLDAAIEMVRDLEEFKRSGSKEAFRKQLAEEYVRRLGAASPDEALATAMMSLVPLHETRANRGNVLPDRPSRENPLYEFDSESDGATVVWCLVIDLGANSASRKHASWSAAWVPGTFSYFPA